MILYFCKHMRSRILQLLLESFNKEMMVILSSLNLDFNRLTWFTHSLNWSSALTLHKVVIAITCAARTSVTNCKISILSVDIVVITIEVVIQWVYIFDNIIGITRQIAILLITRNYILNKIFTWIAINVIATRTLNNPSTTTSILIVVLCVQILWGIAVLIGRCHQFVLVHVTIKVVIAWIKVTSTALHFRLFLTNFWWKLRKIRGH